MSTEVWRSPTLPAHAELLFCCPPRAVHWECFLQHARRGLREVKSSEFLFARECDIGYIAPRAGLTCKAFAKIINNHEVESGSPFRFCGGCEILPVNQARYHPQHIDAKPESPLVPP